MDSFFMVVEQTHRYPKRMEYLPETNTFVETQWQSLGNAKGVPYPYGWLQGYGAPPQRHLDVLLVSGEPCELGDAVPVKLIGVFVRRDGDNKLLALPLGRVETDYAQLSDGEKELLRRLYPGRYDGEGWFGRERAEAILRAFAGQP